MADKILITGATGNTGSEVVKGLSALGLEVKAATTNPSRKNYLFDLPGVEPVAFDFNDPSTYNEALEDVVKVFLVRPPALADADRQFRPFIETLANHPEIRQVVFLSLLGVENNPVVPHFKIEKLILEKQLPYTFLRPGFFMQNLETNHLEDLQEHQDIFVPAGNGKTSFIDVRDIAAVAVKVLSEENHLNRAYALTGSEALTYQQVADLFTEVTGQKFTYSDPSVIRFALRMRRRGLAWKFIMVMIALYSVAKLGKAGQITDELPRLLGREPISMKKYIEDHKTIFL
jgi:uncharacterized protein YbjT (DUF2867 family)